MTAALERHDGDVLASLDDSTLVVTLNRPQVLNALTHAVMDDLRDLWRAVKGTRQVRCVVVTGAGKGFCSGADTSVLGGALEIETAADELSFLPGPVVDVPVITVVNGVAAGGGLHFVADADIAVASTTARFLDPHVSVGRVSGVGPLLLHPKMQWATLTRMALLGKHEPLDAEQALAAGLVSEVVAPEHLLDRGLELAATIARNSPEAVRLTRRSLRTFERNLYATSYDLAWELVRRQHGHPDAAEGPRAFREKRDPVWSTLPDQGV
ncbi:enoyl-CoA hydratase/isomerase family protein [Nocardioides marmotae]|uniref:enoyl-CoA hydratase/isomerase family protein n=1 Tax=Nocardioides marmotae TaxID=2663857 RepID=UPI0012B637CA|nr:enoyl-CoA hydratase/isomerase family protein [Nocardioides marmotae]MBC9734459.1 enoyl-CoA hydratase/isomerase family protein [Nocardioides marmotae]MTB85559.1 enoyl-CoA hydratase/isomerase family protein [Nocardioides marmotae]